MFGNMVSGADPCSTLGVIPHFYRFFGIFEFWGGGGGGGGGGGIFRFCRFLSFNDFENLGYIYLNN